jgi:hypothetical protein
MLIIWHDRSMAILWQRGRSRRGATLRRFTLACVASCFAILGCKTTLPKRPNNVPHDSTYVVGANVGWWEHCSYEPAQDVDHCQIFNFGGTVLSDEIFLPYDGGRAAHQSELRIVSNSNITGPQYVCLSNGRILIPKSDFENQKRAIDSLVHSLSSK